MQREINTIITYADNEDTDQPAVWTGVGEGGGRGLGHSFIAPDKRSIQVINYFLFIHENKCDRNSSEAPRRGTSNEYLQHIFSVEK